MGALERIPSRCEGGAPVRRRKVPTMSGLSATAAAPRQKAALRCVVLLALLFSASPVLLAQREQHGAHHSGDGFREAVQELDARLLALDALQLDWLTALGGSRRGVREDDLDDRSALALVIVKARLLATVEGQAPRRAALEQFSERAHELFTRLDRSAERQGRRQLSELAARVREGVRRADQALHDVEGRCAAPALDLNQLASAAPGFELQLAVMTQRLMALRLGGDPAQQAGVQEVAGRLSALRVVTRPFVQSASRSAQSGRLEPELESRWTSVQGALQHLLADGHLARLASRDAALHNQFQLLVDQGRTLERIMGGETLPPVVGGGHEPGGHGGHAGHPDPAYGPAYEASRRLESDGDALYERARKSGLRAALPYQPLSGLFPFQGRGPNWHPMEERFRELAVATDALRDALRTLHEHEEHAHGQRDALQGARAAWTRADQALGGSQGSPQRGVQPAYDRFVVAIRGDQRYAEGLAYLEKEMTPRIAEMRRQLTEIGRTLDRAHESGR